MNTVLSFMDKIYSDSKTLSIVYIVGAVLLFIFIILLMVSLRKPVKKEEQRIIEPKIDNNEEAQNQNEVVVENNVKEKEEKVEDEQEKIEETPTLNSQSIFEKTTIIPLDELNKEDKKNNIEKALENVENNAKEEKIEEKSVDLKDISSEIPDVDSFVDNVVKKTYEKNEQFSSVYVGNNTSTIKLDKVMENLNVDEKVLESIVPEEEKTIVTVVQKEKIEEQATEVKEDNEALEIPKEIKTEANNSLDNLKKALDEKKKEVELKQDDLKAKLESLKNEKTVSSESLNAEDLLNKLNSMKEK